MFNIKKGVLEIMNKGKFLKIGWGIVIVLLLIWLLLDPFEKAMPWSVIVIISFFVMLTLSGQLLAFISTAFGDKNDDSEVSRTLKKIENDQKNYNDYMAYSKEWEQKKRMYDSGDRLTKDPGTLISYADWKRKNFRE